MLLEPRVSAGGDEAAVAVGVQTRALAVARSLRVLIVDILIHGDV
jgi:hypothetical protein